MFLRHKLRRKDGKEHGYWNNVRNRRVSGGRTVQRHVLYLGEIKDSQRAAWCQTIEAFDDRARAGWGTRWLNVLKTLVTYRLIDPGSEWRLHRQWYEQSPMGDPLGEDFDLVQKDNLYRCLDKLLGHQHLVRAYRRVGEEVVEPNGLIAVLGQSVDTSVRLLSTASNSTAPRSSRLLSPNCPSAASFMRCHPVPEPMGHRVEEQSDLQVVPHLYDNGSLQPGGF